MALSHRATLVLQHKGAGLVGGESCRLEVAVGWRRVVWYLGGGDQGTGLIGGELSGRGNRVGRVARARGDVAERPDGQDVV